MSNPAPDKTQEAFKRRFGPEPPFSVFTDGIGSALNSQWKDRQEGYRAGREDALQEIRENLLCPVHANLDREDNLEPFDNCIACIRNERNELKKASEKLRKMDDAEVRRIRNHCRLLGVPGRAEYEKQAATDFTTLLDTVKALERMLFRSCGRG